MSVAFASFSDMHARVHVNPRNGNRASLRLHRGGGGGLSPPGTSSYVRTSSSKLLFSDSRSNRERMYLVGHLAVSSRVSAETTRNLETRARSITVSFVIVERKKPT